MVEDHARSVPVPAVTVGEAMLTAGIVVLAAGIMVSVYVEDKPLTDTEQATKLDGASPAPCKVKITPDRPIVFNAEQVRGMIAKKTCEP